MEIDLKDLTMEDVLVLSISIASIIDVFDIISNEVEVTSQDCVGDVYGIGVQLVAEKSGWC
jgi:hypothetical protein